MILMFIKLTVFTLDNIKKETTKPEVVAMIKYMTSDAFRLDESKRPQNDAPQMYKKLNVD